MAKVLVTGYGGFLGQSICRQLIEAGHAVRGLARRPYPKLTELGVEGLVGDASREHDCRNAMAGIDGVIHTAAIAGVWGPRAVYESVNVDATRFLLDAARQARVRAFVFCSSPSVTFDGSPQRNLDESAPYPRRWLCDYPRTKAMAEQLVLSANRENEMLTCALRPHLIWGDGDPHLIPRLIERAQSGRLRRVGDGKNLIDTVHVDAAASAHCQAAYRLLDGTSTIAGRPYFITDGHPVGCWEWIEQILQGAGVAPPQKHISLTSAYVLGYFLELAYRAMRRTQEPPMTRFVAKQLGVDHYFSIKAAKNALGYLPIEASERQARFDAMLPWLRQRTG